MTMQIHEEVFKKLYLERLSRLKNGNYKDCYKKAENYAKSYTHIYINKIIKGEIWKIFNLEMILEQSYIQV